MGVVTELQKAHLAAKVERDAAVQAMYEALECALHELNFAYNGNEYSAVLTKGRVRKALAQARACGIGEKSKGLGPSA